MEQYKIEEVALDQPNLFAKKDSGITRKLQYSKYLNTGQVVVISGVRRSGKSTLLKQFSDRLTNYNYINFDDERLVDFRIQDFNTLLQIWQKHFRSKNILIDEIQNVPSWERFVRRIHDEGYKVFITGSNSKLLSSELATHLTGRYKNLELFPFSFIEFAEFRKESIDLKTTSNKAKAAKLFEEYLFNGGFPEYAKSRDKEFVKKTYEDVIYRDIISRYNIRESKAFRLLSNYLFTNFTKETSYGSLKKVLGFKSSTSVREYVSRLQEAYLLFELYKYDYSLKKQYTSNKKIYAIDNGMRNEISFQFSEDRGRLLENMIFIELKRRGKELYYFKNKKECDFIIFEKNKITEAIQVATVVSPENRDREVDGLLEALEMFKLREGCIITEHQKEKLEMGGKTIKLVPVIDWLVDKKIIK